MKSQKIFLVIWMGVITLTLAAFAALESTQSAQAQCNPLTSGGCPQPSGANPSSGGGKKKGGLQPINTPTWTPNPIYLTYAAQTEQANLALTATATSTPCVVCPLPDVQATKVAGPGFIPPGVINALIVVVLVGLAIAGFIIVIGRTGQGGG